MTPDGLSLVGELAIDNLDLLSADDPAQVFTLQLYHVIHV
jgi:hypothetical protein